MHLGGRFAASGLWPRGASFSIAGLALMSIVTADAAWSRAISHSSPKHHAPRLAALTPEPFLRELAAKHPPSKPSTASCTPSKFRIVLDVGHTAESEGAIS